MPGCDRLCGRGKRIAQKQVVATTFYSCERSPERMLRRKALPGDESRSLPCAVAAGHLGSESQELFVQAPLRKEVAHQARSAFDQDHVTFTHMAHRVQDCPRAQDAGALPYGGL